MKPHQFVAAIRTHVMEAAISDTVAVVENPPGRRPSPELAELSSWFKAQAEPDRVMIVRMLALVARQSVFGFLAAMDGSRKVFDADIDPDYLELRCVRGAQVSTISGPHGESLHELL